MRSTKYGHCICKACKASRASFGVRRGRSTASWFGEFDELVMIEARDLCARRAAVTGTPWEIDHMVPMKGRNACGLHIGTNVQVIPKAVNLWKGQRELLMRAGEWLHIGRRQLASRRALY